MNMMRHCRQCRADAVGMLGEDRGDEFTLDKIEDMDIDYAAAMEKRKVIHAAIQEEMDSKRLEKERKAALQKQAQKLNTRPVLMAVATSGQGLINVHFGHAKEFLIYEASPEGVRFISHRKTDAYCSGDATCGETESALQRTIRSLSGCEVVLCSKVGYEPWEMLETAGIMPNGEHAMENIEEAVMAVYEEMAKAGKLTASDDKQRANA
jgi:nitrogen fixation protein NifB